MHISKYLTAVSVLALSCVVPAVAAAQDQDMTADVVHVFTTEAEQAAVNVLRESFEAQGGTWENVAIAGSTGPLRETINLILAGDPPSASQFSSSQDYYDLVDQNMLASINEVAEANNWRSVMPEPILDAMSRDGNIYLAPFALHTPNWLWYNAAVLEDVGIEPPQHLDESFFEAMDQVRDAGYIPFALSGVSSQLRFVFEGFLIDSGGADNWNAVWRDKDEDAIRSEATRTAFERFRRVGDYADEGAVGRAWNQTLDLVVSERAAFDILGDWAMGSFNAAGMTVGEDFGCILTGDTMIIHADFFGFPKQGRDDTLTPAQRTFAESLVLPETQIRFSLAKGSIPPRNDVDISQFNMCAQISYDAFSHDRVVGNARAAISPTGVGEYTDLLNEFMYNPNMSVDDAVDRFEEIVMNN